MKTKIKVKILTIALLSLLMNPSNLSAESYEAWNNSFMETSYAFSETSGFVYQSDLYYMQEMNSFSTFPGFAGGDFLTLNSGLLRGMGGDEGMDTGSGTSGNDHLHYANDVPVGDGIIPLLLAVFGWIVIVITSPPALSTRRGSSRSEVTTVETQCLCLHKITK